MCSCGRKHVVANGSLRSGSIKSCGCQPRKPRKNITGCKIGPLTAISYAGGSRWVFRCKCGDEVTGTLANIQRTKRVVRCECRTPGYSVYGIRDMDGAVVYVGKTKVPIGKRLDAHINCRYDGRPLSNWLLSIDYRPEIIQLAYGVPRKDVDDVEAFYIKMLSSSDRLLNVTHNPGRQRRCLHAC
jgi:hypothetical protein